MDDKLNLDREAETTSEVRQTSNSDSDSGNENSRRLRRDKSVSFPDDLTGGGVSTTQSLEMVINDDDDDDDDDDDGTSSGGVALYNDASGDGASDSDSIAASEDPYDSDTYNALAGSGLIVKAAKRLDMKDDDHDAMEEQELSSNGDAKSEAGEVGSQYDRKRRLQRLRNAADQLDFGGASRPSSG